MRAQAITCAFTGHRPEKLPWGDNEQDPRCRALQERIADAVEQAYLPRRRCPSRSGGTT